MKSFISHELCKASFVFEASEANKSLYYNHNNIYRTISTQYVPMTHCENQTQALSTSTG